MHGAGMEAAENHCDASRFPAMRMLRDKAASLVVSRKELQRIRLEEVGRFDTICTAEWSGKQVAGYEHLQGRAGQLTYHFIFATLDCQPTEDVSGFVALYETSEQRRNSGSTRFGLWFA